ncbi:MAG: transcriptional repressor [Sphaerochaetaceae bacterium]|jgi:Fe2+ or Zn2+ uptake regulation protein|nr:transcriptional repressor [Candidatus Cloacimonadota bacterium]
MTKARKATLDVLKRAKQPLSATEVHKIIKLKCDVVTVYRNLNYLEEIGEATSFVYSCSETGTQRYYTDKHSHFFHCEKCHSFINLGSCKLDPILKEYRNDFNLIINNHTLNLSGICPACSKKG